jgi:squalene-hopene/tetraprenyl-beta-curcumene cyclase
LRQWTTSLALAYLASSLIEEEKKHYRNKLIEHQTKEIHPFTRSAPGGCGWTTFSGSVPDADDTSAALIALHRLGEDASETVQRGIRWLLDLQNRDGGIPTFCRGWGGLPFDKSCPDISAHTFKAFSCYENELPKPLRLRVIRAKQKIIRYLKSVQREDGAFIPLWFGDQKSPAKEAPVYGSAVVLEHLSGLDETFLDKTKNFFFL